MSDSTTSTRTDGHGRAFVCEARSPDGAWHIEVFGANQHGNCYYVHVTHPNSPLYWFPMGRVVVSGANIEFRWSLPNGGWGIFIDGECWAIYARRSQHRINPHRLQSRHGLKARPYDAEDIRFFCAKRRGQRKGTRGFIIEE